MRATTLDGSLNYVPRKARNALLRLIVGKGEKCLFACAASTEIGRLCQQCSAGYVGTAVKEVGTCAEKKFQRLGYQSIVTNAKSWGRFNGVKTKPKALLDSG